MAERDRQHARFAFQRLHARDEGLHRLARRVPEADHLAVEGRRDRSHAARRRVDEEPVELAPARFRVDVRILLERHDRRRRALHQRREMTVQIELQPDRDVRTHHRADVRREVALAVVVAFRGHRAVQQQLHRVDRHRRAQVGEDFVAQRLVDMPHRAARGLGDRAEALGDLMAVGLDQVAQEAHEGAGASGIAPARVAVEDPVLLEAAQPRRRRCEGVGLGGEVGDEELHGSFRARGLSS